MPQAHPLAPASRLLTLAALAAAFLVAATPASSPGAIRTGEVHGLQPVSTTHQTVSFGVSNHLITVGYLPVTDSTVAFGQRGTWDTYGVNADAARAPVEPTSLTADASTLAYTGPSSWVTGGRGAGFFFRSNGGYYGAAVITGYTPAASGQPALLDLVWYFQDDGSGNFNRRGNISFVPDSPWARLALGVYPDTTVEGSFDIIYDGVDTGPIPFDITESSSLLEILSGGGPFSLTAGETHRVTLRYSGTGGDLLPVWLGADRGVEYVEGIGLNPCATVPELRTWLTPLGTAQAGSLQVENRGVDPFSGEVVLAPGSDPSFSILSGGGPFTLEPGTSREVVVEFAPQEGGTVYGELLVGSTCPGVSLVGQVPGPHCRVIPGSLDFPDAVVGEPPLSSTVRVWNDGTVAFSGQVRMRAGDAFSAYPGSYTLPPGQELNLTVTFDPPAVAAYRDTLVLDLPCSEVPVTGTGSGPLTDAVLALHVGPVRTRNLCPDSEDIPSACEEYVTTGTVGRGYTVYLIAARYPGSRGVAEAEFGLDYDGVAGSGVDIYAWISCADYQQPAPDWPAPQAGNLLSWYIPSGCGSISFRELGAFYVYAYSPDILRLTGVDGNLPRLRDCQAQDSPILPGRTGYAAFSPEEILPGCNPCTASCAEVTAVGDRGTPPARLAVRMRANPVTEAPAFVIELPEAGRTVLEVFDLAGRRVAEVLDADLPAGAHEIRWDGRDEHGVPVPAGIYFHRLVAGNARATGKLVILGGRER